MKSFATFLPLCVALLAGIAGARAERDITLRLNSHNFQGNDTIAVTATFISFDDDPITGDVYADIIDEHGDVIGSAILPPATRRCLRRPLRAPRQRHQLPRGHRQAASRYLHKGQSDELQTRGH